MSPDAVDVARKALEAARDEAGLAEGEARAQYERAERLRDRADVILADAMRHRDAAVEALQWFDGEFPEDGQEDGFTVPEDSTDPEDPAWTEVGA